MNLMLKSLNFDMSTELALEYVLFLVRMGKAVIYIDGHYINKRTHPRPPFSYRLCIRTTHKLTPLKIIEDIIKRRQLHTNEAQVKARLGLLCQYNDRITQKGALFGRYSVRRLVTAEEVPND